MLFMVTIVQRLQRKQFPKKGLTLNDFCIGRVTSIQANTNVNSNRNDTSDKYVHKPIEVESFGQSEKLKSSLLFCLQTLSLIHYDGQVVLEPPSEDRKSVACTDDDFMKNPLRRAAKTCMWLCIPFMLSSEVCMM